MASARAGSSVDQGFIRPLAAGNPNDERFVAFPLALLVTAVALAGLSLALLGAVHPDFTSWEALLVFGLLAVFAERSDLSVYGDSRVSLAFVPIFASVVLGGISGLTVVVLAAVLASINRRAVYKNGYNFGALMLAGAASAAVFDAFGVPIQGHDWPVLMVISLLAGGANFLANSILVATAIALSSRASVRAVWSEHFFWLWPHYLVLAATGLAMVAAYELIGLLGVAVFLAPPLMMRLSIKQYLERTTRSVYDLRQAHSRLQAAHEQLTSAMTSLNDAYDGTLRSLVAALDARDSETAGHSERVADLTMAIAEEIGVEAETGEWRNIFWGALLHDVGKIAITDGILRKPGRLTEAEWDMMRTHPDSGFQILSSVDFLAPAAQMVLCHHERYDGLGYPRGLAREAIPLGARIFAIADAFDAMTSHRAYRTAIPAEEALAEILRGSGTQFDPIAVAAFLSVYQARFVRAPTQEPVLLNSVRRAILEAAGFDRRA